MRTLILIILFFMVGCGTVPIGKTVCRHDVLRDMVFLQEKGHDARVVIYRVDLLTSHAQAQVLKDGEWWWVENYYGDVYLSRTPAFKIDGWVFYYTLDEYIAEAKSGFQKFRTSIY